MHRFQRLVLARALILVALSLIWLPAMVRPSPVSAASDTITVVSNGTSACAAGEAITLRCAMTTANAEPASDSVTIDFAIPGCASATPCVIQTTPMPYPPFGNMYALPPITHNNLTIDGYSQSGSMLNTGGAKQPDNAVLLIQLNGPSPSGYYLAAFDTGANNTTIKGLSLTNFGGQGEIQFESGTTGGTVQGDWIGLAPNGQPGSTNFQFAGVLILSGAGGLIGGPNPADRNVISGHSGHNVAPGQVSAGVLLEGGSTQVENNFIGLAPDGTTQLGNGNGILALNATGLTIGPGNVLSGNQDPYSANGGFGYSGYGIGMCGTTNSAIQGNYIGPDRTGEVIVGSQRDAMNVTSSCGNGTPPLTSDITVGGNVAGQGNVIAGAAGAGITYHATTCSTSPCNPVTIASNLIGVDANNAKPLANGTGIVADARSAGSGPAVGTTLIATGNIISGNTNDGLSLSDMAATLQRNYIGSNAAHTGGLGNGSDGIRLGIGQSTDPILIGGPTAADGNVIDNNTVFGVDLQAGPGAHNTISLTVQHNDISNNSTGSGIVISGGVTGQISDNTINGNSTKGNVTTGTAAGPGIDVGYHYDNSDTVHVGMSRNVIVGNGQLGIDLAPQGPTCAPPSGATGGPNDYIPCPVIDSMGSANLDHGSTCSGCTVEVFRAQPGPNDQNYGQAAAYLGTATTSGNRWQLSATSCTGGTCTYPGGGTLTTGQIVTATATRPVSGNSAGQLETSEFSLDMMVSGVTVARLTSSRVEHRGNRLLLRWRLTGLTNVVGFVLTARSHRLNARPLMPHRSSLYRYQTRWQPGPYQLHVLLSGGGEDVLHLR